MNVRENMSERKDLLRSIGPLVAIAGAFFVLSRFLGGKSTRGKGGLTARDHFHEALEHEHEHVHVTHERTDPDKGVGGWAHLTAQHSHLHNHASLEHSHRPHRDFNSEHRREAHVHDHEHPTVS